VRPTIQKELGIEAPILDSLERDDDFYFYKFGEEIVMHRFYNERLSATFTKKELGMLALEIQAIHDKME